MLRKSRKSQARPIRCYLCGHPFEVSARAMSTTCPACSRAIKVEDVVVRTYVPVNDLRTCGVIEVTRKGRVAARTLQCGVGLICDGSIEGSIETDGEVAFGPKATWKGGEIRSRSLSIADGAILVGRISVPGPSRDGEEPPARPAARRTRPTAFEVLDDPAAGIAPAPDLGDDPGGERLGAAAPAAVPQDAVGPSPTPGPVAADESPAPTAADAPDDAPPLVETLPAEIPPSASRPVAGSAASEVTRRTGARSTAGRGAAKEPATGRITANKTAAKKAAAKKAATKKPATKKTATKKTAAKKPATKKPATKKPAAKKTATKKPVATRTSTT